MRIYKVFLLNTGSEQFPLNQSGLSASVILYCSYMTEKISLVFSKMFPVDMQYVEDFNNNYSI